MVVTLTLCSTQKYCAFCYYADPLLTHDAGDNGAVVPHSRSKVSFSDAIQDFRSTRIEEVICYRFDQFDTAAQLVLKLSSVACANGEVFSLQLLSFMIRDDSSGMAAFACLHSLSVSDRDMYGGADMREHGINIDAEEEGEGEDTLGFEPKERGTSIKTGSSCWMFCMSQFGGC
jgi:hypothetical protein